MLFQVAVIYSFIVKLLPIRISNCYRYLRRHYGPMTMKLFYEYVKLYLRIHKIRQDILFIRTCKREDLVPTFARIRLANPYLRYTKVHYACSKLILEGELKFKKHLLSRTYRHMINLRDELQQCVPNIIFNRLNVIREEILLKESTKIQATHANKLNSLRFYQQLCYDRKQQLFNQYQLNNDRQVMIKEDIQSIVNLTERKLTDDEKAALQSGLHHVYPTREFDHARFVCNIEYLYARLINLKTDYRHYERKEAKQQVVHKLSSVQLNVAGQLRSIASKVQIQAAEEMKLNRQNYSWINRALKTLRTDESIIITRPDKGRGIVIMYKRYYIQKMELILQDQSKFNCITEDPTLANEDRLIRLLLRLKDEEFITQNEYDMARPSGSRAARLYGLPKTHKQNYPLRPVMSAIKTVGYGLGKVLTFRLSHLRQSPYVLKDSVDFLKKIKKSTNADMTMVSFDVVSLFTNVPLTFTIKYILDQMYPVCSINCKGCNRSSETFLKFFVLTFNKSKLFENFTDYY